MLHKFVIGVVFRDVGGYTHTMYFTNVFTSVDLYFPVGRTCISVDFQFAARVYAHTVFYNYINSTDFPVAGNVFFYKSVSVLAFPLLS